MSPGMNSQNDMLARMREMQQEEQRRGGRSLDIFH
jgi:hypothetical protein